MHVGNTFYGKIKNCDSNIEINKKTCIPSNAEVHTVFIREGPRWMEEEYDYKIRTNGICLVSFIRIFLSYAN